MTKKKTTKKTAKKRGKKTTKAANDAPLPMPPMPGVQEHIAETLCDVIPEVQEAAIALEQARSAAAAWGREVQKYITILESALDRHGVEGTYYDGVVEVVQTTKDPKRKLEVKRVENPAHEAAG